MSRRLLLAAFAVAMLPPFLTTQAPQRCATVDYNDRLLLRRPEFARNLADIEASTARFVAHPPESGAVYRIPVVVHVVWNTPAQNLSDERIRSQIQVLNEDFRRRNLDAARTISAFQGVAADAEIEFCLAGRDPQGAPTNGITRTQTATRAFSYLLDDVKFTATGGRDAWPRSQYLNIWVCNLAEFVLGYAAFPGSPAATDGIVIDDNAFGRRRGSLYPFDLGRTATHEVGHWLNLRHIWGDNSPNCGDDFVADTPPANSPHVDCVLSAASCGGLNMVQNYMDYSDDDCMNIFTQGQKLRMRALFQPGGFRASLLTSPACLADPAIYQINQAHAGLHVDAVHGTPTIPAILTRSVGQPFTLHLTGSNVDIGNLHFLLLVDRDLVPLGSGGAYMPAPQILNLPSSAPLQVMSGIWPGDHSLTATFRAPGVISLQRVQFTTALPNGYAWSQPVQIEYGGGCLPAAAPANATILSTTTSSVTIGWTDMANDEVLYRVARLDPGEDPNNPAHWDNIGGNLPPNTTSFRITGLDSCGTYMFKVRCANQCGMSAYSNIVVASRWWCAPAAPQQLTVTGVGSDFAGLSWLDVADNETAYRVARLDPGEDPNNPAHWDNVGGDLPPNTTSFVATGLVRGATYRFKVRCTNAAGNSDYSNTVIVTTACPTPAVPSGLTASTICVDRITLTWADNANDELGYRVAKLDPGEDPNNPAHWDNVGGDLPPNTRQFTVPGLVSGAIYQFKVRCFNGCGPSAYSSSISVSTLASPAAPTGCIAARTQNTPRPDPVRITWNYSGPPVTGFRVARLDPGEDPNNPAHWDNVGGDLGMVFSFVDNTPTLNGQTYYYKVRAYYDTPCGRVIGPYSNQDGATP